MERHIRKSFRWTPGRIVAAYITFGILWILFSDDVANHLAPGLTELKYISMAKGIGFIIVTGLALNRLIFNAVREQERLKKVSESRQQFLAEVLQSTETATWEYDRLNARITDSANLDMVLGCSPSKISEQSIWDLAIPSSAVMDEGKPFLSVVPYRRSDGTLGWLESRVSRSPDTPDRILGTSTDVTDRVQLERKVSELTRDLERRVDQRTVDLRRANEELESFTRATAHDLRAPLRAIGGYAKILRGELETDLVGELADYFDRIDRNVIRMAAIIDHLLELARIGRTELRRETIDLSAIAEKVLAELRQSKEERVILSSVQSGLTTSGDPVLVRTLLENLIGNAWKYTSQEPEACIEVGMRRTPEGLAFFVRDDGIGFEPDQAEQIFKPFERLRSQSEFPGDGIGLSSVSKIVAMHGGKTWAEGAPGVGATFYFTLGVDSREGLSGTA